MWKSNASVCKKNFARANMYFWQSVYNYDLGGSQMKKGLFLAHQSQNWKEVNLKFFVKSLRTQAIRHHDHVKLTKKTKFRRQLLLFTGKNSASSKIIYFVYCVQLHCTLFLATVLLFTTVSRLSVFLVTVQQQLQLSWD